MLTMHVLCRLSYVGFTTVRASIVLFRCSEPCPMSSENAVLLRWFPESMDWRELESGLAMVDMQIGLAFRCPACKRARTEVEKWQTNVGRQLG